MKVTSVLPFRIIKISKTKHLLLWLMAAIFLLVYFVNINNVVIVCRQAQTSCSTAEEKVPRDFLQNNKNKNIFFLKVHKSASSTIQNILMRYGSKYDLNFVLPYSSNYLGHPVPFDPSLALPVPENMEYNIFCHHTRYQPTSIRKLMPKETVFITILRNPQELFESLYSYFDLKSFYEMDLLEFVRMPQWWLNTCDRYFHRIGINQIAFDFGLNSSDFADKVKIRNLINEIDGAFDLVLISEYFDESLILLKQLLQLSIEDIVYISHNKRLFSQKNNVSLTDRNWILQANHIDKLIYEHFLKVFQEKLERFGESNMRREVLQLQNSVNYWKKICGAEHTENEKITEPMYKVFSNKVQGIQIRGKNDSFCQNLAKSEMPFTNELRQTHLNKYGSTWLRFLYLIHYY